MTRGRRKRADTPVQKKLMLPQSLADELDAIFRNPITGRASYGAFSGLVAALLRTWLIDLRK